MSQPSPTDLTAASVIDLTDGRRNARLIEATRTLAAAAIPARGRHPEVTPGEAAAIATARRLVWPTAEERTP